MNAILLSIIIGGSLYGFILMVGNGLIGAVKLVDFFRDRKRDRKKEKDSHV